MKPNFFGLIAKVFSIIAVMSFSFGLISFVSSVAYIVVMEYGTKMTDKFTIFSIVTFSLSIFFGIFYVFAKSKAKKVGAAD